MDINAIISMNAKPIKVYMNKGVFNEGLEEQEDKKEEKMMPRPMDVPVKEMRVMDMDKGVMVRVIGWTYIVRLQIECFD